VCLKCTSGTAFPILNGKAGINVGTPKVETNDRAAVSAATLGGKVLKDGDLKVLIGANEYVIPASSAADDTKSSLVPSLVALLAVPLPLLLPLTTS
jgi:hypothetical protein